MQRIFVVVSLLSLIALSACGGSAFSFKAPDPPGQHKGPITLAQMLSELDELKAPPGTDEAQFEDLKQSLRTYLVNNGDTKFTASAPSGESNAVDDLTPDVLFDDQGNADNRVSWSYRNIGDYDQNSEVNVADLSALGSQLTKSSASPDWETKAKYSDGDGNGEVNISDITPLGSHLLSQVSQYRLESSETEDGPWAEVTTVGFGTSEVKPSGQRMFTVPVAGALASFYRVIPVDNSATDGIASLASQAFVLSDKAELADKPGGVQFVSLDDRTLVLAAPDSSPTSIAVGDIIVGNDDAGYLWRVLTVVQDGTTITVTGEDAAITDLVAKGLVNLSGLFAPNLSTSSVRNGAKVTSGPHELAIDCPHTDMTLGGYDVSLNSLHFKFDPDLELLLSVNGKADPDNPVQGFVTKLTTPVLEYYVDCAVQDITFSGTFPTLTDDPAFRTQITTVPLDFNADVNGVPMKAKWNFDLWFGIAGSGSFDGTYQYNAHADYSNASFGGWWNPLQNWTDLNEFTSSYSDPEIAAKPTVFSHSIAPCTLQYYLFGKLDAGLFSDPNRKAELTFKPAFEMALTPSGTPMDKDLYTINGFLNLGRDFQLGSYGSQNLDHNTPFTEPQQLIDSGFVDRTVEPQEISGTVMQDTTGDGVGDSPLAGVIVYLYDNTDPGNPVDIDSALTPSDGTFEFTNIAHPLDVKLEVDGPGYSFNPLSIAFTYDGGYVPGNDFVGTGTVSGDKSISGTVTDGTNPLAGIEVDGSFTGLPGKAWIDVTDGNGQYTLSGISPGLDVTVTPDLDGTSNYSFTPTSRDYPNVSTDITGADFTGSLPTHWEHTIGFYGQDDQYGAIAGDPNTGDYYCVGYMTNQSGDQDALITKYDTLGNYIWDREEGVGFIGGAVFHAAAWTPSGIVTVGTFDNENTFTQDILVMKWDFDGNVIFKTSYGITGQDLEGWAVAADGSGAFFVGGETYAAATGRDIVFLSYDASGVLNAQKVYNGPADAFVRGMTYESGNIYLVGHMQNTLPVVSEDVLILKVDAAANLSFDELVDVDGQFDAGLGVTPSGGGSGYYLCGNTVNGAGTSSDGLVMSFDSSGSVFQTYRWRNNVPTASLHGFNGIVKGTDGLVYTAGYWKDNATGLLYGSMQKWDFLSAPVGVGWSGGNSRLFGVAWAGTGLNGHAVAAGFASSAGGTWDVQSPFLPAPSVTVSTPGVFLGSATGVVNPPSPFTGNSIPTFNTGDGGKDAFISKLPQF
jgi:hypothetical protein